MRFVRYGEAGAEKPGVLDGAGGVRDLSGVIDELSGDVLGALPKVKPEKLPLVDGNPRLGPPIAGVGKFLCIGLNFTDHAAEAGMEPPPEPILFHKATSAIVGPTDPISLPRGSVKTDWEVELGVVIGKAAKYVDADEAMDHIAGYTVVNDVSEREYQIERAGQWTKGKSCDTYGPIGPWLVTPDEVGDPQDLDMSLDVNGKRMQTGNTARMVFPVGHVISYLSQMMTLHPGDIIATGTPPGVGMAKRPQTFLKEGDVVELTIERLGSQRSQVISD
ncbi:fumarylacetoacetate hydrolase family protein [Aliiroseovarius subalbicans]|uniref:fumarylacetoacetate hydrolase family protein n=1 Tax=Aliiroseovarius subalbicans TaxID=2925840 RepID=UPI001F5A027A|nr:fumarylacetoacetate hydrolase family protein [Aliiroseovarius subalbicans]MCI2398550.1 fumarylacetoacetate hydrolase family protein [Aliiroseovarius subalbicans]